MTLLIPFIKMEPLVVSHLLWDLSIFIVELVVKYQNGFGDTKEFKQAHGRNITELEVK